MPANNNTARKFEEYLDSDYDQPTVRRVTRPTPVSQYRVEGGSSQDAPQLNSPRRQATAQMNVPPVYRGYAPSNSREIAPRPTATYRPSSNNRSTTNRQAQFNSNPRLVVYIGGAILAMVISYFVISFAVSAWQNWQDDMTYGYPRITRLEANVGHNEVANAKTLFVAQNIRGQISITEYPGGDPSKTRVLVGPHLFGKDKDRVPVKLQVKDVNADGIPDLVASVEDQQLIYVNENSNFRPITEQERAKLKTLEKEDSK